MSDQSMPSEPLATRYLLLVNKMRPLGGPYVCSCTNSGRD